jgi:hypothetical protein
MSSFRRGDEHLHHCDSSHRWTGGPLDPAKREVFLETLRNHVAEHRSHGLRPAETQQRRAGNLGNPTTP